jgi:hypothetical protein
MRITILDKFTSVGKSRGLKPGEVITNVLEIIRDGKHQTGQMNLLGDWVVRRPGLNVTAKSYNSSLELNMSWAIEPIN